MSSILNMSLQIVLSRTPRPLGFLQPRALGPAYALLQLLRPQIKQIAKR